MMRRSVGFLLLVSLAATGAAPLAGERLLCPMPMSSAGESADGMSCDACAMDTPASTSSLEAAACCRVAPATEAETIPATVASSRRGITIHRDGVVLAGAPILCSAPTRYAPSFDPPAPVPAPSPPPLSTQTTHLRN